MAGGSIESFVCILIRGAIYEERNQDGLRLVEVAKLMYYCDGNFEHTVRAVYEIDDIAEWKVDKKLAHMTSYKKRMRVIWVELPDPEYRKKGLNNADISSVGEQLKSLLRNKYKGAVSNYIYDIVCHTGDNWQHNRGIMDIFGV